MKTVAVCYCKTAHILSFNYLLSINIVPLAPAALTVHSINSTALQLNWMVLNNTLISHYIISIRDNCTYGYTNMTYYPTYSSGNTAIITSLQPITEYCFHMTAINPWGMSDQIQPPICGVTHFGTKSM